MTAEVLAMHATKVLCKSMQCKDIYLMPLIALSLLNRCGDSGGCTDSFGGCRSRRTLGSLQNQSNFSSSILLSNVHLQIYDHCRRNDYSIPSLATSLFTSVQQSLHDQFLHS